MERYVDWIVGRALPTWATRGYDAGAERFRERLDRTGAPLDVPHRAMVQARQIYVYAHAAELGWHDGGALADAAMRSLVRDFCVETPDRAALAFSIDTTGRVVSDLRDAYTHAFALFALAWLHRLTGAARLLALANKIVAFIDAELTDAAHGGLFDTAPVATGDKRQNPLMHLLEAYLFLAETAPGRGYEERAAALVALFRARLFRHDPGVLIEYFARDWGRHADPAKADAWEPGHHFEWAWLLDRHRAMTSEDHGRWIEALYDIACRHGIAATGLIHDELSADLIVTKPSHRVWPHTEGIKAAVARHRAGDAAARARGQGFASALMETFLDRPFAGGWTDQVDAERRPLVDYAPASSLYHLFLAAAEAATVTAPPAAAHAPAGVPEPMPG